MSMEQRLKRDGSGPFKLSLQRQESGSKGKRLLAGLECPINKEAIKKLK